MPEARPKPPEGAPDSDEFFYIRDGVKDDKDLHNPILFEHDYPRFEEVAAPIREKYRAANRIQMMKDAGIWEESKHPRGQPENAGQFGPGGGGSSSAKSSAKPAQKSAKRPTAAQVMLRTRVRESKGAGGKHPGEGYSKEAKLVGDVIYTTNVDDAARALHEDRRVELDQPRGISVLLDRLGAIAEKMIAKGEKAPSVNLCKLTIQGSNLFCSESKGIPRVKMPQMTEDQTEQFKEHLLAKGYKITEEETNASHLRATQNELNGAKVAKIAKNMRTGDYSPSLRTVVSDDDYILDGHHRWAAKVGNDSADNNLTNDTKVPIARINIDIVKLLEEANAFTGGVGGKSMEDEPAMSSAAKLYTAPTKTADEIIASVPGAKEAIDIVRAKIAAGVATDQPVENGGYKRENGTYTPERAALHEQIIEHFINVESIKKYTPEGNTNPVLTILGGRGGSGKSWITSKDGPVDTSKSLVLDSDEVKGMLPEYQGWNAALLHEESSHIVELMDRRAASFGLNVVLDGTLKSTNILNRIAVYQEPEDSIYDLDGYYMYASPETAATRALNRFAKGGTFEGRFVPPEVVLGNTKNEVNFDTLSESFQNWAVYDNDKGGGGAPKLVQESKKRK